MAGYPRGPYKRKNPDPADSEQWPTGFPNENYWPTKSQKHIVQRSSNGLKFGAIARERKTSSSTVKNIAHRIRLGIGAQNWPQCVKWFTQKGWIK